MPAWFKKWFCERYHLWESVIVKFGDKEDVIISQTCDICEMIYITAEGVLFFSKYPTGQKLLSEAIYSVR